MLIGNPFIVRTYNFSLQNGLMEWQADPWLCVSAMEIMSMPTIHALVSKVFASYAICQDSVHEFYSVFTGSRSRIIGSTHRAI
jgi:hypothetical protein